MVKIWYEDPKVLFNNYEEFFPNNSLSNEEKANAIVRFAIYYFLIILIFNLDYKWLAVSIILIMISYCLGYYENFSQTTEKCTKPTKDNPFMNFMLFDNPDKPEACDACNYDDVKEDMRKEFKKDIIPDPADLWGRNISDRNFFTMPWTKIVNEQTEFAKWTYGNGGECKNLGLNCDKNLDNRYQQSRYNMQY